jgi:hypothetical protein
MGWGREGRALSSRHKEVGRWKITIKYECSASTTFAKERLKGQSLTRLYY